MLLLLWPVSVLRRPTAGVPQCLVKEAEIILSLKVGSRVFQSKTLVPGDSTDISSSVTIRLLLVPGCVQKIILDLPASVSHVADAVLMMFIPEYVKYNSC